MMNGGEAADQMVNYATKTGEMVLRLAGAGAKNLAAYLTAILKDNKKNKGKTFLSRLLNEGKELKVFAIRQADLRQFTLEARKYGVLFVALHDKKDNSGLCDILAKAEDAAKLNRIMERMGLADVRETATVMQESETSRQTPPEKEKQPNPTQGRAPRKKEGREAPFEVSSGNTIDPAPTERASIRTKLERIRAQASAPTGKKLELSKSKSQPVKHPPVRNKAR